MIAVLYFDGMSDKRIPPELTEMQLAFAVVYVANGGNGTQAAIDAGYSSPDYS